MQGKYAELMFDMETGGTGADAWIAQFACAVMGQGKLEMAFEVTIDYTQPQTGRVMDASTMAWWAHPKRAEAFEQVWKDSNINLASALVAFNDHINTIETVYGKPVRIWSKGPSFDMAIMQDAYRKLGISFPISFRNFMCYRTIAAMYPDMRSTSATEHYGVQELAHPHTAFGDVERQGFHLMYLNDTVLGGRL
mgnify:CR=1 FL=1